MDLGLQHCETNTLLVLPLQFQPPEWCNFSFTLNSHGRAHGVVGFPIAGLLRVNEMVHRRLLNPTLVVGMNVGDSLSSPVCIVALFSRD